MKKLTFILVAMSIIFVSCGKERKFDENLQDAIASMKKVSSISLIVCSETADTWRKAIYDHKSPSGEYCSDFNEALSEMRGIIEKSGLLDSISFYKDKMESTTSKMNNPPSSRKDCYNDFVEIVSEVGSLSRMATDPKGSLQTYSLQLRETSESLSKKLDQFKIKYGEFMKKDE